MVILGLCCVAVAIETIILLLSFKNIEDRDQMIKKAGEEIATLHQEKKEQSDRIAALTQSWENVLLEQQAAIDLFRASTPENS